MKYFLMFLIMPIISCANSSEVGSVDRINSKARPSIATQDTCNLILSKDLQIKIKALIGSWKLKSMHMIDKKGATTEYNQAGTTIEFTQDHKFVSKVGQILAEGRWIYDNISNHLTTNLEKDNGSNTEANVKQENKIILLSSNKLIYQFDDPVTGTILEMQYEK